MDPSTGRKQPGCPSIRQSIKNLAAMLAAGPGGHYPYEARFGLSS
jgi:hypothetical protein